MMKKYFAKLLSTGGEIIEEKNGFASKTPTKLKLFLCSSDIQIGDKVKYKNIMPSIELLVVEGQPKDIFETTLGEVEDRGGFKVIGEISPEALWVKEGDRFSEEEISDVSLYWCPKYGYSYEMYWEEENECRKFKSIKGPCGHFH